MTSGTNDIILMDDAERNQMTNIIKDSYSNPQILGKDEHGTIFFNSKNETKSVSANELGGLYTIQLQKKGY